MACLLILSGCGDKPEDGIARYRLEPVAEPEALPYRFEVIEMQRYIGTGRFLPIKLDAAGRYGSCQMLDGWRPSDTLSCLVFKESVRLGSRAFRHFNTPSKQYDDWLVKDFDHDGTDEVAVTFISRGTVRLAIYDPHEDTALCEMPLVAGQDRDGNGYWDGESFIIDVVDINGDGFGELLIGVCSGYDLYPRQVMAVDWRDRHVLWEFPVSGQVSFRTQYTTGHTVSDSLILVIRVASKGNSASTAIMDDAHSYVLALNEDGSLRWCHEVGGEFDAAYAAIADYDGDGQDEIVCERIWPDTSQDQGGVLPERPWAYFTAFDLDGNIVDSIDIGRDREIRYLSRIDIGEDTLPRYFGSSMRNSLMIFDHNFNLVAELTGDAFMAVAGCEDFLGRGDKQLLISSRDNRTWLLDREFETLAMFPEFAIVPYLTSWYPGPNGQGKILLAGADKGLVHYILSFARTPWFSVFFRKPWLASVAAAVPLALIIVIVTVALLRIRQKNRVILAAQEELKATQARLIAAEKFAQARSIAGGFAHEIRNALFPARTWLGKLRRIAGNDPKHVKAVDRTEQAVVRAIETTHKISMYTKLEEHPPPEPVDFQQVLQESLREHQDRIAELQVRVDVRGDTRTKVLSHPDLLKVVLDNLIRNALDALTETDTQRIISTTGCAQQEALTVRFEDNGIGIVPEDIGKVFEAFFSTKPTTGTGLGLPMARKIMEMYDGSIEVSSQPGRSTVFMLTFKLAN